MIARPSRSTPVSLATTPPSRAESRRRGKYIRHRAEGDDLPVPALSTYSTSTLISSLSSSSLGRSGCFRSRSQLLVLGSCRQPCARACRRGPATKTQRTPAKAQEEKTRESVILTLPYLSFSPLARSCVAPAPMLPPCDSLSSDRISSRLLRLSLRNLRSSILQHRNSPLARLPRRRRNNSPLALRIPTAPVHSFRHAPRHPGHFPRHSAPEAGHDVLGHARPGGSRHLQKVHAERAYTLPHVFLLFLLERGRGIEADSAMIRPDTAARDLRRRREEAHPPRSATTLCPPRRVGQEPQAQRLARLARVQPGEAAASTFRAEESCSLRGLQENACS
jgi:hypothetical protein